MSERNTLCSALRTLALLVSGLLCFTSARAGEYGTDAELAGAGARAIGMGTSFIGLADDATAVEFNPAGLLILERPEIATQVRYTFEKHKEFLPLSSLGQPTPQKGTFREQYFTPSFFSVVIPYERFAFGLSELTIINTHKSMKDSIVHPIIGRQEFSWDHNITAQQYGLSMAYLVTPSLYAGTTLKMARLHLNRSLGTGAGSSEETERLTGYGANFGMLYRPSRWVSLGLVYKTKMSMSMTSNLGFRPVKLDLTIPDTLGCGVAVFPNDRLRIAADVDTVKWSKFKDEDVNWLQRDDTLRLHCGAEYLFAMNAEKQRAWFVRAGYMWEESNSIYANSKATAYERLKAPKEDPINHATFGLGLALRRFQVDVGVDLTRDQRDFIFSTVLYF